LETSSVVAALAVTLLLTVLALAREIKLRRALQRLLARLLAHWRRSHVEKNNPDSGRGAVGRRDRL
jgi:hypothetical protein